MRTLEGGQIERGREKDPKLGAVQESEQETRIESNKEIQRRKMWIRDLIRVDENLKELQEQRGIAVEQGENTGEIDRKIELKHKTMRFLVERIIGERIEVGINIDEETAKRIIEEGVDARAEQEAKEFFEGIIMKGGEERDEIFAEVEQEIDKMKQGMGRSKLAEFEKDEEAQKSLAERLLESRKEEIRRKIRTEMIEEIRARVEREKAMVVWFKTERIANNILGKNKEKYEQVER